MFHGLSYYDVRRIALQFARKRFVNFPVSWETNGMAGEDWMYMYGFLNRHQNLSLRTPEATSVARAQGFNKKAVTEFS